MKILYIIHDNKKGGAALSFLDMIRGVAREHEVCVLTPHKDGYIPEQLDEFGIWHKSAHYYWWEIAGIGSPLQDAVRFLAYKVLNAYNGIEARRIARMAKDMGVDLIHSNSSTISVGAMAAELAGIPHVWHLRELGEQDFSLAPARGKDTMESVMSRGKSEYIAISEYVAKFYEGVLKPHDPDVRNRIHVICNGISASYNYSKSRDEYGRDAVRFLISGNYCEQKGQIDVAHAVGMLVGRGVTNFKVYMAGRGDYAEVREYVRQNGLEDHVVFCGLVDDMLSLRRQCDVEIVASRAEAFGRVTVEAMRASNPVVGSATGGTTELIEDGVTGFLYEYKDNEALAERMQRFIDNPALAYEMGSKAYEWSVGRFTSEENVEKVMELYRGICDHGSD